MGMPQQKAHFYGPLCKTVWFAEAEVYAKQPWSPLQKKEGMAFPSKAGLRFSFHPQQKTLTSPSAHRPAAELRGLCAPNDACITKAEHVPSLSAG